MQNSRNQVSDNRYPKYPIYPFVESYCLFTHFLAQAALRASPEVALQCVAGHCYYPLSLLFFSFSFLAQAALRAPPEVALHCVAGHCYYILSVFFFSLSFPYFAFDPLPGISRGWKFVSPDMACMQKKADFQVFFSSFYGQRSVTAAWATPSPWSIIIFIFLRKKMNFLQFFPLFTTSVWSRLPGPPLVPGVL